MIFNGSNKYSADVQPWAVDVPKSGTANELVKKDPEKSLLEKDELNHNNLS